MPPLPLVVATPPLSVVVTARGHQVHLGLGCRWSPSTAPPLNRRAQTSEEYEAHNGGHYAEEELAVGVEYRGGGVVGGGRGPPVFASGATFLLNVLHDALF